MNSEREKRGGGTGGEEGKRGERVASVRCDIQGYATPTVTDTRLW